MEYRRDALDKTWHFSRSCKMWPHQSFNIMRTERFPSALKLCLECVALQHQRRVQQNNGGGEPTILLLGNC
jgi:hypothetical protein